MTSVCVYIDGFNLYHALCRFKDDKVKWLDLSALVKRLLMPKSEQLNTIYYFSAYADWMPPQHSRHIEYVKALEAVGIKTVMGHFKILKRRIGIAKNAANILRGTRKKRRMSVLELRF